MSTFIDKEDHRYSRQSYTIGQDTQTKLSVASVLVIGYNSLAQEIIRNLALIGVSKIDIYQSKELNNYRKTGLYYSLEKDNLPLNQLQKLNPTIKIELINILDEDNELDKKKIKKYNVVILTNSIIDDAFDINRITHKLNIPFIMCGNYGLMGYIFNDFCENFIVNDIDGDINELLILESIENKTLKFKDPHKLSDGDTIIITWKDNSESELKVFRKKSPLIIELTEIPNQDKNVYLKIIRKKISQTFSFESLKRNIDEITKITADWSIPSIRTDNLHKLHLAYNKYLTDYGQSPRAWSISDYEAFEKNVKYLNEELSLLAKKFCYTLRGDILPICSIIGGIVSHEVLKALAHKYIPIQQWYYFDCLDLISDEEVFNFKDNTGKNYRTKTKYEGIVNVFGKKFLEEIQNNIPFVIGSGAIGCELIKNLGMMGIKEIYLTDPDHIEKSNLSRQFLFNDEDIRKSKAEVVAQKIKIMNPDTNINVLKYKICSETENIFNEDFHSKIDIYLNALDNVEARLYMDSLSIKYEKPLIDSGTMGSKGNIQVVIPHLTESYGSSKDPDEKTGIPICTIKSFPYKPEHTIQWGREIFETEFNLIPNLLNKYKNNVELNKINDNESKILLKQLYKYINFELSKEYFIKLLKTIFYENHFDNIKEIIDKYANEETDKKLPIYLTNLNLSLEYIFEYIKSGIIILNQIFNTNIDIEINDINKILENNNLQIKYDLDKINSEEIIEILLPIFNKVPITNPIDFDKDNDELCHVYWINLSANMRNIQYSIEQTNIYETRRIAGNIIPAMITTTAVISGFQILEYIRILKLYKKNKYINNDKKEDIDLFKNRFINLNINYYDGITPSIVLNHKLYDNKFISVWTKFIINSFDTLEIINKIESDTQKKIEFMTINNKTVYDGEEININTFQKDNINNILILLEDIQIGIPVYIK